MKKELNKKSIIESELTIKEYIWYEIACIRRYFGLIGNNKKHFDKETPVPSDMVKVRFSQKVVICLSYRHADEPFFVPQFQI
jgi:hypothetical protein